MPRRRINNRQIGQRGLAGWVLSRQLLTRRVLRGPLLAQVVSPAPAWREVRLRPAFRPRLIATASAPEMETAPWSGTAELSSDDERGWAVAPSFDGGQPAPAERTPLANAYADTPDDTVRPSALSNASVAPPRPETHAPTIAQPPLQRTLPPRERLGRRVEERVQETPPQVVMPPTPPAAPAPERIGATAPPHVEQPHPDAPAPYRAETPGAPDAAAMVPPLLDAPSRSPLEIIEPDQPAMAATAQPMPPYAVAPDMPEEQPIQQARVAEAEPGSEAQPATKATPHDEATGSPATRQSAALDEVHNQPALPEVERSPVERLANEVPRTIPVQESSPAVPPIVEPAVSAEPRQLDVPANSPFVASAAPLSGAPAPAMPEATTAADLFTSGGVDRSPAAWLARLTGAAQPQSEPVPAPATPMPPASAPPPPEGAPPPSLTPRFVQPVQARTPIFEPFRSADRPANVQARPDVALPIESDRPAVAPIVASDTEAAQIVTPDDGEQSVALSPIPATMAEALPDAEDAPALSFSGEIDRSPAAWSERLRRAERASMKTEPVQASPSPIIPGQPAQAIPARRIGASRLTVIPPGAPREERAPTPLPEASRRFLQPLVGIDPADILVHEGPQADAAAAAYRADALTDGNAVMLRAGFPARSPETLGLISHELTHIARRRDPRFVPPIAQREDRATPTNLSAGEREETGPTDFLAEDETVARRVESRVTRAARTADPEQPRQESPSAGRGDRSERPYAPATPSVEAREREPEGDRWGGLPAPWEPLPGWFTSPAPASPPMPANVTPLPVVAPALAPVAPVAQLAEQGRDSDADSAVSEPAPAPPRDPQAPAEPDLDALARQVYALLKRRLALERRSFG